MSSLELAIIAPSLLILIFLGVQAALFFYGRSVALQAAREGVSQLRLAQTTKACQALVDQGGVTDLTERFADSVGRGALSSAKAFPKCNAAAGDGSRTVTVQVKGHAVSLLGFSLNVDESATSPSEQFQDQEHK